MKTILLSLFLILPALLSAQALTVEELREHYYQAVDDADAAQQFYDLLADVDDSTRPILSGYKGMANLLMANHVFSPFDKFKYFVQGRNLLEKSIQRAPENLELRFLRFGVQTNAPVFLGYHGKIHEDKAFILSALKRQQVDDDLRTRVVEYMLQTQHCTITEKREIVKIGEK